MLVVVDSQADLLLSYCVYIIPYLTHSSPAQRPQETGATKDDLFTRSRSIEGEESLNERGLGVHIGCNVTNRLANSQIPAGPYCGAASE